MKSDREIDIYLIVVSYKFLKKKTEFKSDKYCPECARAIPLNANVCSYCGKIA